MLEEMLGDLLSPEQVQSLWGPAVSDRDFARQAFDNRAAAVSRLTAQLQSGVWGSREVQAAVGAAANDRLLLRLSCQKYIHAHGGEFDLDIKYRPLLPAGANLSLDDITAALGFIVAARPGDPELWFAALQDEAAAYLHQLRGDTYLARAIRCLDELEAQLLALLDPADPHAAKNIIVHSAAVALFAETHLPWRAEAAYQRFLAAFSGSDPFAGWHSRADADPAYQDATLNAYYSLVLNALKVLCLRNPSDRSEIDRLAAEQPPPDFAPALGMYEPDVVALPDLPSAVFASSADALQHTVAVLAPARSRGIPRTAAVLAAWEAFARRGLKDFLGVARRLSSAKPDDEALGIVVQALRGEAYYRMGRYEDGYLDLLAAEDAARAALSRTAGASGSVAPWTESERDAVARLAQKAGNALAVIGDEDRAAAAYERAAALATGPLARAGNLVNQGNRYFLQNSAAGTEGYITLDATARQEFVLHGSKQLIAAVVGKHVASLCSAEASYQAALGELSGLPPDTPGAQALAATCEINLGNVCWAWGQTLVTEGESQLGRLPLGPSFASKFVTTESGASACYEAAAGRYNAALARLGAGEAGTRGASPVAPEAVTPVASALSSLSEMRYLVARELLRGDAPSGLEALNRLPGQPPTPGSPAFASLSSGLTEAARCLTLIGKDARPLYADLLWRTHYNLARTFRLLGHLPKAAVHFHHAIRTVEHLRTGLRADSEQSAFLHDKHDVYEGYIDLLVEQDAERNMPEIFAWFERSRARAFLSLLDAAQVKAPLPARLRSQAENLLARVSECNEAIQTAIAGDRRDEVEALLAEQKELALGWSDVQSRIARSQQRKRPLPPVPRLVDFQAALRDDQAFLGLLLGDEASYLLLIESTTAGVFKLPPRRTLDLLTLPVLSYATWSNAETAAAFRAANIALTQALLGPVDAALDLKTWLQGKHLLISPDGLLCYLPFETLLVDTAGVGALANSADYPDFRPYYLLSLADLSYVPSASAWLELGQRKREPSQAGLMAVYNVLYDTADPPEWAVAANIMLKLGAVTTGPDMNRVADAVAKAWGQEAAFVRLRSRTDDGAPEAAQNQSTEGNFLRVVPEAKPRVLLFHGHGIYNDRYPSLSGLVFNLVARPPCDRRAAIPTHDDGFLRVDELFELELPGVEMTMLAACQTALGAYRRGEGLNALVRGFLYRGSPAVAATLWEVRADVTSFLLRTFFGLLAEQLDADRARLFSQARRNAMSYVANLYLPYFWAPFVLWGYTGAQGLG
jgi:CHAT domain-containing protein